jgi:pimeloyl-ACP methyl ester carboxylesterase
MATYREQLVYAESSDGLSLAGALITPDSGQPRALIVWIHGAWLHFYYPVYITIGRELAGRGYAFLSANTRGHDLANLKFSADFPGDISDFLGCHPGGYIWERFEEQVLDIAAWIDFAANAGFSPIILAGHSLGATRAATYAARRQDARIHAFIGASPAPLQVWQPDADQIATAQHLVNEGHGEQLMSGTDATPIPVWRSAQNFNSLIDVIPTFDGDDPTIARIACPILLFIGTAEAWNGSLADLENAREKARSSPRVDLRTIEGAGHMYQHHETAVAGVLADWLDTVAHG